MLYVEGLDISVAFREEENKLEKHENNWIAFVSDASSDHKIVNQKEWIFLGELMSNSPFSSCKTLSAKRKMNFSACILLAWLNQ